ncbi:MAG: hypothetical protein Q8R50_03830, partial [Sediminibacterium sp.]|nr:hypothetical protein [Sediminibacterium sp.]
MKRSSPQTAESSFGLCVQGCGGCVGGRVSFFPRRILYFVLVGVMFFLFTPALVKAQLTGGTISTTACQVYNTSHQILQTVAITGEDGFQTITYTWERSTDITFTTFTITGGNTIHLNDSYTLTGTTYYRRKVDNAGNTAYSNIVTVNPNPIIGISPSSPTACLGDASFSVTYGTTFNPNRYSIVWGGAASGVFPDVNASLTSDNLIATSGTLVVGISALAGSGTFTGTLTVLNSTTGCTTSGSASVLINPLPTVTLTPSATAITLGMTSTLTGGGGDTYAWSPTGTLSAST